MKTKKALRTRHVTVISPHRDDAGLSLALSIAHWRQHGIGVTIMNLFTISDYAPFAQTKDAKEVTLIRAGEDRRFSESLPAPVDFDDLHGFDFPLRQGCSDVSQAFLVMPSSRLTAYSRSLGRVIAQRLKSKTVLVPLAVRDHIDHVIAESAGIWACRARNLKVSFYEDLPYAAEVRDISTYVGRAERMSGAKLMPLALCPGSLPSAKLRLIEVYKSQLSIGEMKAVCRQVRAGERIWVTPGSWTRRLWHEME